MGSNEVCVYEDEIYAAVPGFRAHPIFSIEDKFHICSHACMSWGILLLFSQTFLSWMFILLFPFPYLLQTTFLPSSSTNTKKTYKSSILPLEKPRERKKENLARSLQRRPKQIEKNKS